MLHEPEHSPIRLHPLFRPARRRRAHVAQAKWFPAAVVVLLLTARRMALMGPLATGLDGGEWLAIGRGLLGGPQRSTGGAYPPLVPIATMLAANVFGDLTAVRLMAMVSCLALLGAIAGVTLSELGPWVGALVVAVIGSASAVVEPMAFGGYPQQFALAGMVLATWGASAWLLTGRPAALAVAAVSLSFVALTHHVYVLLAFAAAGIAWGAWAAAGQRPETLLRRSWPLATAAGVAAILAAPTLRAFLDAGYTPPLGAVFDLAAAWRYSVREAMPLWTLIAGLGLLSASMLLVAGKATPLALTAFGLAAAGLLAFVPFAEPRSAPPLVAGAVFGVALGWRTLPRPKPRLMLAASAIAATLLIYRGDGESIAFFRFYRVLDDSLVTATRVVETAHPEGAVAVRADRRGWPVGWWFEGLTDARIAVGSDPRWLGFPRERAAAAKVAALFDGALPPNELAHRAQAAGVELLVIRKWEWIGWDRWLKAEQPMVSVLYDDNVTLILRVGRPADSQKNGAV